MKKKLQSMVLCMAILMTVFNFSIFTSGAEAETNIALNKKGYYEYDNSKGSDETKITDGNNETADGPNIQTSGTDHISEKACGWIVDLGDKYDVNKVIIVPAKREAAMKGSQFPIQFKIQISVNGETWTDLNEQTTDYYENTNETKTAGFEDVGPNQNEPPVFDGLAAVGQYVRFVGTKHPARYKMKADGGFDAYIQPRIAEMQVFGTPHTDPIEETDPLISSGKSGFCGDPKKTPTATDKLTDGDVATKEGPNLNQNGTGHTFEAEYVWGVDLGAQYEISKVVAKPVSPENAYVGSQFPLRFKIQVSDDGNVWTDVVDKTNEDYYVNKNETQEIKENVGPTIDEPAAFTGLTATGRYIRFFGTKFPARYVYKDGSWTRLSFIQPRLSELEVYGVECAETDRLISYGCDGYMIKSISGAAATLSTKLTDGDMTNSSGEGWNITTSDSSGTTEKESATKYKIGWYVDLKTSQKISKVVVSPLAAESGTWRGSRFPDAYEIRVSEDAENWEVVYKTDGDAYPNPNVWYDENDTTTERINYGPTGPVTIPVTAKGRYVEFRGTKLPSRYQKNGEAWKPAGYIQPCITELQVYSPVEVTRLETEFKSGDSTVTAADEISGSVTAATVVTNEYGKSINGILIYALYSDDEMIEHETKIGPFASGTTQDAVTFSGLESGKTYSVKVMLWEDLETMKPLCTYSALD